VNGGTMQVSVSVKLTGSMAAPGNTPTNTTPDTTKTVTGGSTQTLSYGTGEGEGDTFAGAEFAIAPSTSLTIDLYAGETSDEDLPDVFKHPAPFRVLRSLVVVIATGTGDASGVRCGGAASNEFVGWFDAAGDKQKIFPGGPAFAHGSPAGVAVTTTARNFLIENLSADVFVRVKVYAGGAKITSGMSMGTVGGVYP
jgi:hypothetical protein